MIANKSTCQSTTYIKQPACRATSTKSSCSMTTNKLTCQTTTHIKQTTCQPTGMATNQHDNQPAWQSTSMHLTRKKPSLSRPSSLVTLRKKRLQTQHTIHSAQPLTIHNDIAPFNLFRKHFSFYINFLNFPQKYLTYKKRCACVCGITNDNNKARTAHTYVGRSTTSH